MMAVRVFVDTNILLRAALPQMAQHAQVDTLLKRTIREGAELWISGQVIREFIVQATHPHTLEEPLTIVQTVREIEAMKSLFQMADETAAVRDKLLNLIQAYPTNASKPSASHPARRFTTTPAKNPAQHSMPMPTTSKDGLTS